MPFIVLPPIRYRRLPGSFSAPQRRLAPGRMPADMGFMLYDSRALPADTSWADQRLAEIRVQFDRDRMQSALYCPDPSQSKAWAEVTMARRIEHASRELCFMFSI